MTRVRFEEPKHNYSHYMRKLYVDYLKEKAELEYYQKRCDQLANEIEKIFDSLENGDTVEIERANETSLIIKRVEL